MQHTRTLRERTSQDVAAQINEQPACLQLAHPGSQLLRQHGGEEASAGQQSSWLEAWQCHRPSPQARAFKGLLPSPPLVCPASQGCSVPALQSVTRATHLNSAVGKRINDAALRCHPEGIVAAGKCSERCGAVQQLFWAATEATERMAAATFACN